MSPWNNKRYPRLQILTIAEEEEQEMMGLLLSKG
jgi:hypothetical protein